MNTLRVLKGKDVELAVDGESLCFVVDFSAKDKEQKPYVMVVASRMGIKKLLLQLDEEMVENFKNRIPRKVFSD